MPAVLSRPFLALIAVSVVCGPLGCTATSKKKTIYRPGLWTKQTRKDQGGVIIVLQPKESLPVGMFTRWIKLEFKRTVVPQGAQNKATYFSTYIPSSKFKKRKIYVALLTLLEGRYDIISATPVIGSGRFKDIPVQIPPPKGCLTNFEVKRGEVLVLGRFLYDMTLELKPAPAAKSGYSFTRRYKSSVTTGPKYFLQVVNACVPHSTIWVDALKRAQAKYQAAWDEFQRKRDAKKAASGEEIPATTD